VQRGLNKNMVDANGGDLYIELFDSEFLHEILLHGVVRLRAQPAYSLISIIAGKSGEIDTRDRSEKPRRLPFLFNRSARYLRLGSTIHRASVHTNFLHPVQVERNSGVWQKWAVAQGGNGSARLMRGLVNCCGMIVAYRHWLSQLVECAARRESSSSCNCTAANVTTRILQDVTRQFQRFPRKSAELVGQGLQLPSLLPVSHEALAYAPENRVCKDAGQTAANREENDEERACTLFQVSGWSCRTAFEREDFCGL
jgi:hypothetical protein